MSRLAAVVFDVDGTLVDSERDGHRVAFNTAFEVLLAGAYLHYRRPELLHEAFPAYQGRLPGSFWIRRTA